MASESSSNNPHKRKDLKLSEKEPQDRITEIKNNLFTKEGKPLSPEDHHIWYITNCVYVDSATPHFREENAQTTNRDFALLCPHGLGCQLDNLPGGFPDGVRDRCRRKRQGKQLENLVYRYARKQRRPQHIQGPRGKRRQGFLQEHEEGRGASEEHSAWGVGRVHSELEEGGARKAGMERGAAEGEVERA
ncbi:hypothetical protein BU23DRAFT_603325 [Bimuria novae-zelandiae CBS 107.79]|uniref:Uncharacterized protein n=1 Tax=Bimuria novae-zelandiae CBS 107.79 TaxID=1447943 RepID=A0A6A5UQ43_9PLEO|nr:hypothetical protein BU23DRAFT_603325 [Bimuria novae-zelandiae CBS 107.79]